MRRGARSGRMERERQTVAAMIDLYCEAHHGRHVNSAAGLCPECAALRDYAFARLGKCPFGDRKPTCRRCRIHCYKKNVREHVQEVMRFSGPRMLFRHPVLSIRHSIDQLS